MKDEKFGALPFAPLTGFASSGKTSTVVAFINHANRNNITTPSFIHLEQGVADQYEKRKAAKNATEIMHKREIGWITEQLESDIAALGGGPKITRIFHSYKGWSVYFLQWLPNGVAAEIMADFKIKRPGYDEPFVEAALKKETSRRFSKFLKRQSEDVAKLGDPRICSPEEVDLTAYTIEKPLVAALLSAYGDRAGMVLRKAIANNAGQLAYAGRENPTEEKTPVHNLELQMGRNRIIGNFDIKHETMLLQWIKGSLTVGRLPIPDALVLATTGRPLGHLIKHPLLAEDMEITAINGKRHSGTDGHSLVMKNVMTTIPADW